MSSSYPTATGDHFNDEKIAVIRGSETLIFTTECAKGLSGNASAMSPRDVEEAHGVTIEVVKAYNHKRFRDSWVLYHPQGTGMAS